jgi:5-methylcytosine-specific restriction protein A
MHNEFLNLAKSYPRNPIWRDPKFFASPVLELLTKTIPSSLKKAVSIPETRYEVRGSAGDRTWTHTPWVAILDHAVTTSVKEGFYIVYLLSFGNERLYLTLNQGCTTLKEEVGIATAKAELSRRAAAMRSRIEKLASRMTALNMNLNVQSSIWRGKLYEAGLIVGIEYDIKSLPSDHVLTADLLEALQLYSALSVDGGWSADDDLLRAALADEAAETLAQAKIYGMHRAIERQASHSKKVKKKLGTRCMACKFELSEIYGAVAKGLIEAHHMTPLASLADGEKVHFDPVKDFAVLCPNCHRTIHKLPDCSDLAELQRLLNGGALATIMQSG